MNVMRVPITTRMQLLLLLGTLPSLAAAAQDSGDRCCNLRNDGAWISDSNYAESGMHLVPFGTPLKITGQGRCRVPVEIDGKPQAIGNDHSRDTPMDAFLRKYVVPGDPRRRVAGLPPGIRAAIGSARVTPGMSRGQVAIAIGWSITSESPHLDAPVRKYWLWTFSPYDVVFDAGGRVVRVDTDPDTRARVFMP